MESKSEILNFNEGTTKNGQKSLSLEENVKGVINKDILSNPNKYLFGLPNNIADKILKYLDFKEIMLCSEVNKTWLKKIKESKHLESKGEMIFLASVINFIYGCGNSQRLCSIVDKAFKKSYESFCECKDMEKFEKEFANYQNLLGNDKLKKNKSAKPIYFQLFDRGGNTWIKIFTWYMVLLGILSIKKNDLKFETNADVIKKINNIDKLIYDYITSDKFKNQVLCFLNTDIGSHSIAGYFRRFTGLLFFGKLQDRDHQENDVIGKVFLCFLKVAFYKMMELSKDVGKSHFFEQFKEITYKLKSLYLCKATPAESKKYVYNVENAARYLFVTKELKQWFDDYKYDFIYYFGSDYKIEKKKQKTEYVSSEDWLIATPRLFLIVFLPFFNKMELLKDGTSMEKFFTSKIIKEFDNDTVFDFLVKTTAYIPLSSSYSDEFDDYEVCKNLNISQSCVKRYEVADDDTGICDPVKMCNCLHDPKQQFKIKEDKDNLYFNELIIRFFDFDEKNLSNDNKYLIKYISKFIFDNAAKNANSKKQNLNKINLDQNQSEKKTSINKKTISTSTNLNGTSLLDKTISSDEKKPEQLQKPTWQCQIF